MVYKFQCGLFNESYYEERVRRLAVKSGEYIGISSSSIHASSNKRVQPRKDNDVCHHLLNLNYSPSSKNFDVLQCHQNKKYLLELKESLFIMRHRTSMNQNMHFSCLCLFDIVSCTLWTSVIRFFIYFRSKEKL